MARILAVGGGSGGHVTPVVAVFREIHRRNSSHQFRFWCDSKFGPTAKKIFSQYDQEIPVQYVSAGKFRRYHGVSRWLYLRPSILLPNMVDLLKVSVGFVQSLWRLIWWRPDVVFIKGGFVCLPVGYAAKLLGIPLVLHDSDAHPGLTNRLLAPFAAKIGTGAPLRYYSYPSHKTKYIGVPVAPEFRPYSEAERRQLKTDLGFTDNKPLVVVTGGGLGAVRINNAIISSLGELLQEVSVFLISGTQQYDEIRERVEPVDGWRFEPFINEGMARVLAAADIVVARAGATTLSELAALHKPTIIVPNAILTAGHQLKNAKVYQDKLAAIVVTEKEMDERSGVLAEKILHVVRAQKILRELGENFGKFSRPDAASDMAEMILKTIPQQRR